LAGPGDFREKRDNSRAKLAEVARKLVSARQVLKLAAARKNFESKFRKREQQLIEPCADERGSLLGIKA
jgi:hypothetical protein